MIALMNIAGIHNENEEVEKEDAAPLNPWFSCGFIDHES